MLTSKWTFIKVENIVQYHLINLNTFIHTNKTKFYVLNQVEITL